MARFLNFAIIVLILAAQGFGGVAEWASASASAARPEPLLRWRGKVIPIAISNSLLRPSSNVKFGSDLVGALRKSLRAWEEAAGVEFREYFSDKQNVNSAGNSGDGVSLVTVAPSADNAGLFARNAEELAATTRVFFDSRGRISEADVVLNPYQQFSTDGTFGTFDAEATFMHEIGHVLGLDHSAIRGSTMSENFGKNGLFGLSGFSHRTLSAADRALVRARYGWPEDSGLCCGTLATRLTLPEGRPASNVEVWLENAESGAVVGQGVTASDGTIEIGGLDFGEYVIYSGRKDRPKRAVPSQEVARVSVLGPETVTLVKRLEAGQSDLDVIYTGFNGQLSFAPVPINAGRSYTVFVGGRNLSAKGLSIRFSSPYLSVTPGSLVGYDYGDGLSAVSFEVVAAQDTPVGEYSVFCESTNGSRATVVGGIVVRSFNNPFTNFVLDSKSF